MDKPILYIVIPCYNEEKVLPKTSGMFLDKLTSLITGNRISPKSRVLFVNDGSRDSTWDIISELSRKHTEIEGVCLSRNRGHQNALLAGLMTAKEYADITISIDCDGQDDINAMDEMITEYENGCDIVYGVRSKRKTDTFFKRTTALGFYRLMQMMGADIMYNHADYRLMSRRALQGLSQFKEVNLFLRGLVPMIGYRYGSVYYERYERIAGESHYPLKKMLAFAFDGITSLSVKPIRFVTSFGVFLSAASVLCALACLIVWLCGISVQSSYGIAIAVFFACGAQLTGLGIVGEYVGKIYIESKHRPRFIIKENTLGENIIDK